jgi:hypothetical protein
MANKLKNITVRMYRTGFGDCFLLFFNYTKSAQTKRMLIDFGAWKPEEKISDTKKFNSLASIGEAIKIELNNKPLDVVVVTHEHKDHLNGFKAAEEHFRGDSGIKISEIWLSWIENLGITEAENLKNFKRKSLKALENVANKTVGVLGTDAPESLKTLERLLSIEDTEEEEEPVTKKRIGQNQLAMNVVKNANINKKIVYHEPGTIIESWDGIRFFVLGPPKDNNALYTDESSKDGDLYLSSASISEEDYSFFQANFDKNPDKNLWIKNAPFDEEFMIDRRTETITSIVNRKNLAVQELKGKPDIQTVKNWIEEEVNLKMNEEQEQNWLEKEKHQKSVQSEYDSLTEQMRTYFHEDNDWRKIETDWLATAERLAIKLNSHTNNTSLVLAIEIIDSGDVLLFPGDAQFGNWKSWEKVSFKLKDKEGNEKIIKSDDLLKRTVFYKTGHHASHNATAKNAGLEKMKDSLKVTLIPIARETAKGNEWPIPHPNLYNTLKSIPNHGVLMADYSEDEMEEFKTNMEHHKDKIKYSLKDEMFIEVSILNKS